MWILITGAKGQVGAELTQRAGLRGHKALICDVAELDITDAAAVDRTVAKSGADVVINAAAYTAVDKAEQESARALAINRNGPAHLAAACKRQRIPLLHISTDYVYDGLKSTPYTEDDPTTPLGVYGESKREGDLIVRQLLQRHLILRVSWVFGIHGQNFVKTMLRLAKERETLRVVADQHGCPTYAGDIARTLITLAEQIATLDAHNLWGTYHYCGAPATTWHGFASEIITRARAYQTLAAHTVEAITTAEYPTPAARPLNTVLDCARLSARLGIQPPAWSDGLDEMLATIYAR